MKFSFYNKVRRYAKRHLFSFFYGNSFQEFGDNVSIINPDIIEGEEYISLGNNVSFNSLVWILALKKRVNSPVIRLEKGVTIGRFAHIVAIDRVVIEKNVLIADKVYISDNIHSFQDISRPIINQDIEFKGAVVIGENSWIGENVSIIGAKVGKHCVIGANALVNKDIPDYCVAVGTPARVIKKYSFKEKRWIVV